MTYTEKLDKPEDFDCWHRLGEGSSMLRLYAPAFLSIEKLRTAPPEQNMLDAIEAICTLNADNWSTVYLDHVGRNRLI
jgi:hypothetical protein